MYSIHESACAPKHSAALAKGIYPFSFQFLLFTKKVNNENDKHSGQVGSKLINTYGACA